jgi:hypothetical protein
MDICPRKFSRTTADGRLKWSLIATFRGTAKSLNEGIYDSLETESPYPDISPSVTAAYKLIEVLGIHPGHLIFMPSIEWSRETARYMMHLACLTERKLCEFHELDSMSVRKIPLNGPSIDQLAHDIWELQFTIITFISFADALSRS